MSVASARPKASAAAQLNANLDIIGLQRYCNYSKNQTLSSKIIFFRDGKNSLSLGWIICED